jgi:GTP pyrophosphokinase
MVHREESSRPRSGKRESAPARPQSAAVDLDALRAELLNQLQKRCARVDIDRVGAAYDVARHAHDGQMRSSGQPYLTHTVSTCRNLIDLLGGHLDTAAACAALLHDVVEDTPVTLEEIESKFGEEVATLVDGVTKISGFHFYSQESEQAENFRKMLLSMARDLRDIFIKLSDRLHNMQTVEFLPEERGARMARESRDIYAPLAHRLGIAYIKRELEDLSLKALYPEGYRELVDLVAQRREEREKFLGELIGIMRRPLKEIGVHCEIQARPKHFYSIFQKMNAGGRSFEHIYDLYGLRIVTRNKAECYQALGIVHDLWSPVQGRFKDYVATPKSNLYQSLHTTVAVPGGEMVEIQIRTQDMHRTAETGVAAHYIYKRGGRLEEELDRRLGGFVSQTADWQRTTADDEYIEFLRSALYQQEVFAYTPKRELKRLPRGATPLDFAFLIHTQVGHQCVGARANGSIVPLRYQIQNGDTIEVITSPTGRPHQDWLSIVKTASARSKIRHSLREQHRSDAITLGREMLARELKRRQAKQAADGSLAEIAEELGIADVETLYSRLGQGTLALGHVVRKLVPEKEGLADRLRRGTLDAIRQVTGRPARGVSIQGIDNVLLRFAKCCQPVPGDPVIGVITQGRGITVHHRECPNTFDEQVAPERKTQVEWSVGRDETFPVRLLVYGSDRPSLLADIAKAISAVKVNIRSAGMAEEDRRVRGVFVVEVATLSLLQDVIRAVRRVKGVTGVERQAHSLDGRRKRQG